MKPNLAIKKIVRKGAEVLKDQAPNMLAAAAVGGVVVTVVLAVRATVKAKDLYDEEMAKREAEAFKKAAEGKAEDEDEVVEYDDPEPLTKKEIVKLVWKEYIPVALSIASTAGFVVMTRVVDARRSTALAAAAAATTRAYEEYRAANNELHGKTADARTKDKVAENVAQTIDPNPDNPLIYSTGEGTDLCIDPWSGRPFWHSVTKIKLCEAEFAHNLVYNDRMSLNDWYDCIGLPHTNAGEIIGWTNDIKFELCLTSILMSNGKAATVIGFDQDPSVRWRDVYL